MINRNQVDLDLNILRMNRRKRVPMPQGLGTAIDQYEIQQKELELQIEMLNAQTAIERQKAEALIAQLQDQIITAETQIVSFMNDYQKSMFEKIYNQVKVSEETLKFKNTDIYDMSFISNMDYSKVTVYNDTKLMEKRVDRREEYRQAMKNNKAEFIFANELIKKTDVNEFPNIYYDLHNQKSWFLKQYYLSAIAFYQESTVIGFLMNPTNNLENLKEFIEYNESNIKNMIYQMNSKRLAMGEVAYAQEIERVRYIEKLTVTAKARLKYLMQAYEGKWTPPTIETLHTYATANDLTYSKAVYELNEKSRQTLCVPNWVMSIAEMYNQIEVYEQGVAVVPLNPYDAKWIRKAKEVINMESIGVKHTFEKLNKALDEYWKVLTYGYAEVEDYHLEQIIEKALKEDTTAVNYKYTNDFAPVNFDEDMQGLFDSFKSFVAPVIKLVENAAGVLVDATRVITKPVAKATKSALDNTLGRVLPSSIYDKISTMTDAGLNIVQLNLDKKTFRQVCDSVVNIVMIGPRINKEIMGKALEHGFFQDVNKYSGGLLTSAHNLSRAGVTVSKGGKIDWRATALDALKVGLAVASGGTAVAIVTATNYIGEKTGLDKTTLGIGILAAAAMIAAGQATFASASASGATTVGTKALINNTGLGDSSLGRSVASIGVSAAIGSIQNNTAFAPEFIDKGIAKLKEVAKNQADDRLDKISKGLISVNGIEKAYDFYNSDKTIAGIYNEAVTKYTQKYDELVKKAEGLTMEKIKEKAQAETDRFVQKRLNELYNLPAKYTDKLLDYLMAKYGPRTTYDDVIQPDDYLNYQIYTPLPDKRIFNNVVYTKNSAAKVVFGTAVVAGIAYIALND